MFVDSVVDGRQQEVDVGVAVAAAPDDVAAATGRHGANDLVGVEIGAEAVVAAVRQATGFTLQLVTCHL